MKRIRMTRKEVEQYLINMRILPSVENQEPLEIEAAKLQKAYNKGFEDCKKAIKYPAFMKVCQDCGLEYCGYSKCPRCGGDQYDLHYIR